MTSSKSKTKISLSLLIVLVSLLSPRLTIGQNFTVENNSMFYESVLTNVYGRFTESPVFRESPWCLIDSSAGFAFLYCGKLDYSLIFDTESFTDGKVSKENDDQDAESSDAGYQLLEKI